MSADWPETREDLIERFASETTREHRAQFIEFIDSALSRPNPNFNYLDRNDQLLTVSALTNMIYDHGFVYDGFGPNGWIDRTGRFWTCHYACHERLLELMDMNSIEQEHQGWIKIRQRVALATFAPNDAQMRTMLAIMDSGIPIQLKGLEDKPVLKKG